MRILFGIPILVFCLPLLVRAQQEAPCLCLPGENIICSPGTQPVPGTVFNLGNRHVHLQASDQPTQLMPVLGARYKANWIFGDGNHFFPSDGTYQQDTATYSQPYTFHRDAQYEPFVIFTEKKSNSAPPTYARRTLDIHTPPAAPAQAGSTFNKRLEGNNQSADIQESAPMRPKYPTAFAVSSFASPLNKGIYFFYNSKKDSVDRDFIPAQVQALDLVNLPNYAGSAVLSGAVTDGSAPMNAIASLVPVISQHYLNYVFLEVADADFTSMPADFDEYRIFPILKTIWNKPTLPLSQFMVLVVGFSPPGSKGSLDVERFGKLGATVQFNFLPDSIFYTPQRLAALNTDITTILPNSGIQPDFNIPQSDLFVRGIDQHQLVMLGSIDPNELEVRQICPDGPNRYKVNMSLQVCNKGYLGEMDLPVVLSDLSGSIGELVFEQPDSIGNLVYDGTTRSWNFTWKGYWGAVPNPFLDTTDYVPECNLTFFSVVTDWAGVQALTKGKGLNACVTFSQSLGNKTECHTNLPIDSLRVLPLLGYKCLKPGGGACWELLFLLLILLLILLYDRRFGKNLKPNENC